MFSRAVPSLRSASRIARPIAATPSPGSSAVFRPAAVATHRSYSAEAEAKSPGDAAGAAPADSAEAAKIKELETRIQDLEKDRKYKQAEIQTLSRRIEEERRKASDFAISKFALSLLSTSDVLSTALSHVPKPVEPGTPLGSLSSGVELTQKALWKTFEQNGVIKMEVKRGDAFDPNEHEATFQIPAAVAGQRADGKEWGPGEVVEVGKEGWMIGNRVLRPAQVGVTQIE